MMFCKRTQLCQSLKARRLRVNKWDGDAIITRQFSNNYGNERNKTGLKMIAPFLFASSVYLYFQEGIFSSFLVPVQREFLHYKTVVEMNKNIHEKEEHKKKMYETFDPESSMQYFWKKLKLDDKLKAAFEGILSALAQEKIKNIKKNKLQIMSTSNRDKRTLEALEIARVWKIEEGPVIYFHKGNYSGGKKFRLFSEYDFENEETLRNTLEAMSSQKPENLNFWRSISQFWMTRAAQENVKEPILTSKSLLIIMDDSDVLIESQEKGDEDVMKFLHEVKNLMKEDLVKVLLLCDDDHKLKAAKIVNQDSLYQNDSIISAQTNQDFLEYITNFTGLTIEEAKKFVDVYEFDIFKLVELKKFLQADQASNPQKNHDLFESFLKNISNTSQKSDI